MHTDIRKLIGRQVVVTAGDLTCRGILRELGVDKVLVLGIQGLREIPWDRISRIQEEQRTDGR